MKILTNKKWKLLKKKYQNLVNRNKNLNQEVQFLMREWKTVKEHNDRLKDAYKTLREEYFEKCQDKAQEEWNRKYSEI